MKAQGLDALKRKMQAKQMKTLKSMKKLQTPLELEDELEEQVTTCIIYTFTHCYNTWTEIENILENNSIFDYIYDMYVGKPFYVCTYLFDAGVYCIHIYAQLITKYCQTYII